MSKFEAWSYLSVWYSGLGYDNTKLTTDHLKRAAKALQASEGEGGE